MHKKYLLGLFGIVFLVCEFFVFFGHGSSAVGATARVPSVSIGARQWSIRGGVIALTSEQAPMVKLQTYESNSLEVSVNLYKADIDSLLSFLIHDDKNNQKYGTPSLDKFNHIVSTTSTATGDGYGESLPLEKSGIYFLSVGIDDGATTSKSFIVRSKISSIVTEMNGDYVFWTQDMKTLRSVSSGKVTLYELHGGKKVVGRAIIGKDGTAKHKIVNADIAVVESGDSLNVLPLNMHYLNTNYEPSDWYETFSVPSAKNKIFVFTDRPIYIPGDKLYYKSLIRKIYNGNLSSPANSSARVYIYRGYDEKDVVAEKKITIDSSGSINGEFVLPKYLRPGWYTLVVDTGTSKSITGSGSVYFQVEYYRKPEYFLDVSATSDFVISGDDVSFQITGKYFFGRPLAGRKVEYLIESSDYGRPEYVYYFNREFNISNFYSSWYTKTVDEGSVVLDENGSATVKLNYNNLKFGTKDLVVRLIASYLDDTQNRVYAGKVIYVNSSDTDVYRKSYTSYKVGKKATIPLVVLNTRNRQPVSDFKISVFGKIGQWKKVDGQYKHEEKDYMNVDLTTDSKGEASINFTPESSGEYSFTINFVDGRGVTSTKKINSWIYDGDYCEYCYGEGEGKEAVLSIVPSKEEYNLNDQVKLNVKSEIPDRDVFVALERDFVSEYKIVKLRGKSGNVTFSQARNYMPNIIAAARSFSSDNISVDSTNIKVNTDSKAMNVEMKFDQATYGPGEKVTITIKTTDKTGRAVPAELTVWAVDKALFELADSNLGDVMSAFWSTRYDYTVYRHSLEGIANFYNSAERGGGGEGSGRELFRDTAVWLPKVKTNSAGLTTVSFKLPDNLTTWRVTAVGSNQNNIFGQSQKDIIVTQNVIVRPVLPNLLRVGDELTLTSYLSSYLDSDQIFNTSMNLSGTTIMPTGSVKLLIGTKETKLMDWNIGDLKYNPDAKISITALSQSDKKIGDKVTLPLPIYKVNYRENIVRSMRDSGKIDLEFPADTDIKTSEVILNLAASFFGQLPAAMDYLLQYPYGCVEQTTSRLVPIIIAKKNENLYKEILQNKKIDEMILVGINRLSEMQKSDGGWSFWYGENNNAYITAYVVENLVAAKESGYYVDRVVLEKAEQYLKKIIDNDFGKTSRYRDIIAATYALTFYDNIENKYKVRLEQFSDLPTEYVSLAVMANHKNGYTDLRDKGIESLLAKAKKISDKVYFWDSNEDDAYNYFGTKDAATALALRALMLTNKYDDLIANTLSDYASRGDNHWSNTFATAQIMRTATDFAQKEKLSSVNIKYTVEINDRMVRSGSFTNAKDSAKIKMAISELATGTSSIKITVKGSGHLYSSMVAKIDRTNMYQAKVNNGIELTRKYVNTKGEEYPIGIGDTVDVYLTVRIDSDILDYGIIEDHLPAGLIPINTALKNENERGGNDDYWYYDDWGEEATFDGMMIYFTPWYLSSEKDRQINLHYRARAVSEGIFTAPPAVASFMYREGVYGRTEAQQISIVAKSPDVPIKEEVNKHNTPSDCENDCRSNVEKNSSKKSFFSDLSWPIEFIVLIVSSVVVAVILGILSYVVVKKRE